MTNRDFEYEVAFSFAAQDEAIATQLNDLISDRLQTFIYSERQKEIAGRDGQEAFSEVYAVKARLVVVLYRATWGQTPWTRVEMDAIKNRSLNDGWDFTVFIPTEAKPSVPPWLPKTRLWVGLERWGAEGAAAVIEARATECGADIREETIKERAARHERKEALRQKQRQFVNSDVGVNAARGAYASVKAANPARTMSVRPRWHNAKTARRHRHAQPLHSLTFPGLRACKSGPDFRRDVCRARGGGCGFGRECDAMTLNVFDQNALYHAHLHACFAAVREGFPHLAVGEIVEPPHDWFDAALARQVAMHLMVTEFKWPKRRVVETENRSREAINRALRMVDARLGSLRFAAHYRTMALRARALITLQTTAEEEVA
ncbi:hypothetical protein AMC78_CH03183 [Rhizobium phaseoli]|uniref:hypothetical protein n=1 Tax=Rhizobium phaseoli TaxID=396 RepID=UPI0007F11A98|nr:hypothetical protein [Rhizobium phaseoli]ANM05252.1 hypothetical protein AMC78_CH03183 [Rhizobium phaseoli]